MLAHEFEGMPAKGVGLVDMVLRCRWCFRTPATAREDGCSTRELAEKGTILLSDYNPEGARRFEGRNCVTCERPIMGHELRQGYTFYWCFPNQNQFSDGIEGCVWDVDGMKMPEEPRQYGSN